jgi:Holliday junction resolvase RusA-like endonuclease
MGKIHARLFLEKQQGNEPRLSGPLALYVTFFMPIPKSLPQRKRLAMENLPHQIRPDLDNLLKWVGDISNELLFNDDCTIALISSRKIYSMAPRTVFTLVSLKSLDLHDEPFINAFGDK